MTGDLIAFLTARLNEDEQAARAATPGPWEVDDPRFAESIRTEEGTAVVAGGRWGGEATVFETTEDAVHIARHDPARVLAEVDAKRKLIDAHARQKHNDGCVVCDAGNESCGCMSGNNWSYPCDTVKLLALPYANHPDYRDEWRP